MKREILLLLIGFIVLGIMFSSTGIILADDDDNSSGSGSGRSGSDNDSDNDQDDPDDDEDGDDEDNDDDRERRGRNGREKDERKIKIEDGKRKIEIRKRFIDEDGIRREIRIKIEEKDEDGEYRIKLERKVRGGDLEVKTKLEVRDRITGNESIISAILSNGEESRINFLPDEIHELALERLQARNLTFELEEETEGDSSKAVYKVKTNKNGRFLGIIKLKMRIEGQIDPETGEFIGIDKPWWAFLVSGEDSDQVLDGLGDRVTLCHIPPGNPDDAHTITVGAPAARAHLAHGDVLDACEDDDESEGPEEELKIKAEILNGTSEVKVELEFDTELQNQSDILNEILNKIDLTEVEIGDLLEIENTTESHDEERVRVEIDFDKDGEDFNEVEFEFRIMVESDVKDDLVAETDSRLALITIENLENALLEDILPPTIPPPTNGNNTNTNTTNSSS
ncbi:MAG: hypothetical protein ACE5ES_04170 [Candidatus Nanoarchaeia archaeon]